MSRSRRANKADVAWQAIDYLVEHDLGVKWTFPEADPPSEEIRHLLMPYFANGEIERTTAWHLRDYLVERLEEDHLLIANEASQSSQDSRRPVFRVVCGDDD